MSAMTIGNTSTSPASLASATSAAGAAAKVAALQPGSWPRAQASASSKALTGPPAEHVTDGVMLALYPEQTTAETLSVRGGTEPEELHLTVAYLGKTDAITLPELVRLATECIARAPITGEIAGHARFTGGERDVMVALFDSPALERLRRDVCDTLDAAGVELGSAHGYTPHITLGYLDPGDESPVRRLRPLMTTFSALSVVHGTTRIDLPFLAEGHPVDAPGGINYDDDDHHDDDGPAPMVGDPWLAVKARKPPYGKGGIGGGKGPDAGPKMATGAFVALGDRKGRVDLIVTNGTVPGAKLPSGEPAEGTADSPAARVVEYEPAGDGTYRATGRKFAVSVAKLRRIPPLRTRGAKSLAEALAWAQHGNPEGWDQPSAGPPLHVLREVYERGVKSWPGPHRTALGAAEWALGRVDAFADTWRTGTRPDGYHADADLLPS